MVPTPAAPGRIYEFDNWRRTSGWLDVVLPLTATITVWLLWPGLKTNVRCCRIIAERGGASAVAKSTVTSGCWWGKDE